MFRNANACLRRSRPSMARNRRGIAPPFDLCAGWLLLNAHGGNSPLSHRGAEARVRFNMLAVATSWDPVRGFRWPHQSRRKALDIHAAIRDLGALVIRPDRSPRGTSGLPVAAGRLCRTVHASRASGPQCVWLENVPIQHAWRAGKASRAQPRSHRRSHPGPCVGGLAELLADMAAFECERA